METCVTAHLLMTLLQDQNTSKYYKSASYVHLCIRMVFILQLAILFTRVIK